MATPTYVLHRIRRKLSTQGSTPPDPPTRVFDERRDAYQEILEEVHILGGDLALDDLSHWIVARVEDTRRLPETDVVRERARMICEDLDVILPEDSTLRG